MSLYRTYRPKAFADVAGQDHIVSTLEQAVKQDKLSHAYLFSGTRGTGKTSIARILSKHLLTHGIGDELLRQHILASIDEGSLVDLIEIDAASNTGVDNIRELIEKIQFSPVVGGAKVYIIDEVHMLSKGAFNALLKTLEEPPAYAYFILATTELHKIPATIQSRCQRFLFRPIREEDLIARLQYIADAEHITVERTALRAIAHSVQGSMRDAISLLDQLRSLPNITITAVHERVGETGHEYVEQMLAAIDAQDAGLIMELVRKLEEAAAPLEQFTRLLLAAARDRLHQRIEAKQDTKVSLELLDALLTTIKDLRIAPVPGLVLESQLLSIITPTGAITKVAVAPATVDVMVRPSTTLGMTQTIQDPVKNSETPLKSAEILAPDLTLSTLTEVWPQIVEGAQPASVKMSLKNGQLHALEDTSVVLRFTSLFHRDKAGSTEGLRSIEDALERIFKRRLKIKCVLDSEVHAAAPMGSEASVNLAEAAAEIF